MICMCEALWSTDIEHNTNTNTSTLIENWEKKIITQFNYIYWCCVECRTLEHACEECLCFIDKMWYSRESMR
jgi:hypothetical protein